MNKIMGIKNKMTATILSSPKNGQSASSKTDYKSGLDFKSEISQQSKKV
jgi:hypothetical protein